MLAPRGGKTAAHLPLRDGMILSIQSGKRNYSEPRLDGLSPYFYESFEVGIFSKDGSCLNPFMESDMKLKSWSTHWSEYEDVAGWVPPEVVQEIYDDLREPDETG
tara:strand:+ start:313 stop:627 length:315 start_codon:yes stop_codon:yes gene_type:complete